MRGCFSLPCRNEYGFSNWTDECLRFGVQIFNELRGFVDVGCSCFFWKDFRLEFRYFSNLLSICENWRKKNHCSFGRHEKKCFFCLYGEIFFFFGILTTRVCLFLFNSLLIILNLSFPLITNSSFSFVFLVSRNIFFFFKACLTEFARRCWYCSLYEDISVIVCWHNLSLMNILFDCNKICSNIELRPDLDKFFFWIIMERFYGRLFKFSSRTPSRYVIIITIFQNKKKSLILRKITFFQTCAQ